MTPEEPPQPIKPPQSHVAGAGLENRYTGRCFVADSANDIWLDGYDLIDARVGYRVKTLTAALCVRNLLDEVGSRPPSSKVV